MEQEFANEMAFLSLGATAGSVMTDCEKYGMCYGCDEHCPVLIAGKCENEDSIRMYYHLIEL
jgi:hypothetical protein